MGGDSSLLSFGPHTQASGPRYQPHLSGDLPWSLCDCREDILAQCHLRVKAEHPVHEDVETGK